MCYDRRRNSSWWLSYSHRHSMTPQNLKTKPLKNKALLRSHQKHPFHILGPSPLPFLTGFLSLLVIIPQVFSWHGYERPLPISDLRHIAVAGLFLTVRSWFLEILAESQQGYHTKRVQAGLRLGRLLFIASEVRFFFAFFWAFFHVSLIPSSAVGAVWPPVGTQEVNPWGLALVNTRLLLTSGATITAAHSYLLKGKTSAFSWTLFLTVILGITFLLCQAYEYTHVIAFSWRDNIYGSIFYITTGFHGFHVTIGTLFLLFCWLRHDIATTRQSKTLAFVPSHHFGFEAAAWYWHFVDVVWLFLFLTIYWWGGHQC